MQACYLVQCLREQLLVKWSMDAKRPDNIVNPRTHSGLICSCHESSGIELGVVLDNGGLKWYGCVDRREWNVERLSTPLCI